jgi:hypothetical protein
MLDQFSVHSKNLRCHKQSNSYRDYPQTCTSDIQGHWSKQNEPNHGLNKIKPLHWVLPSIFIKSAVQ